DRQKPTSSFRSLLLNMDQTLMVLLKMMNLLSGFCSESIRLVGGSRRCDGQWELNLGEWRPVEIEGFNYDLKESVKLVNGGDGCSGRLEVKVSQSDQSNQSWSSVCEADFDHQEAEVVCREFHCGSPTVLTGGLYGEVEAPTWTPQFQCGGNESSLLDCRRSDSARNSCSPGKAVGLTCSEPLRLVEGPRRCEGRLQIKQEGKWRLGTLSEHNEWTPNHTEIICKWLGCGSAVSMERNTETSQQEMSLIYNRCIKRVSSVRECRFFKVFSTETVKLNCLGESNSGTSSLTGSQAGRDMFSLYQPEHVRLVEEDSRFL
uniref:SRCR domain-containing protein n=1 Tax=Poecilia reticulata TaxID=8081 RepID=A0A3P9N2Z2_POERE